LPIFFNTLLFTAGSLAVGLPLAILLAWLLERTAIPGRVWIANLILVPMTIPSLLSAIAWIQLLDPRIGLVNIVLRGALGLSGDTGPLDIYSLFGMCFVQGLRLVPSAYLMIAASFRAMDPSLRNRAMRTEHRANHAARDVADHAPRAARALIYFIIVVINPLISPGCSGSRRASAC
jgi:iron(III) transport system permease protein